VVKLEETLERFIKEEEEEEEEEGSGSDSNISSLE